MAAKKGKKGSPGQGRPLTQYEIARHGHATAALREAMERHNISPAELNLLIGLPRSSPNAYAWIRGISVPGDKYRNTIAKQLGIPEEDLMARVVPIGAASQPGAAQAVGVPVEPKPRAAWGSSRQQATEPFSFSITTDGQARLRVDVTLPADKGLELFSLLIGKGLLQLPPKIETTNGEGSG